MKGMSLPDYKGGSIVNLMSSIGKARGMKKTQYSELKLLPSKKIKDSKNIIMLVLDGMGYNLVRKYMKGTIFEQGLKGSMTSVFPATTAAAISAYASGLAPLQHAIPSWYVFFKEMGVVARPLRFSPRFGTIPFSEDGISAEMLFDFKPFSKQIKTENYLIQDKMITGSDFSTYAYEGANKIGCVSLNDIFNKIARTVKLNNKKKYIYAYWGDLDYISHVTGPNSKETKEHLFELINQVEKLLKKIKDTNSTLIISADHGHVYTKVSETLDLQDHPRLNECLTIPLTGEPRAPFCYVHPSKAKQFESYVKTKLSKYCVLIKGEDAIKKNLFGLGKPNKKILERIGDYILLMKGNYVLQSKLFDQRLTRKLKGQHGGLGEDEMKIPLLVFEP